MFSPIDVSFLLSWLILIYFFQTTESLLLENYPGLVPVASPSSSLPASPTTRPSPAAASRAKAQPVQWVETGDALAAHYSALRDQAIHHANNRNSLFDLASQAYVAGARDRAAELSRLARIENDKMVTLHSEAAEAIFSARNKGLPANVVDFHGLHVKEAIPRLHELLARMASSKQREPYLITGTGHHTGKHSGQGKSRLVPAVQEHLSLNYGFIFEDSSTDKRGGALRVFLH